ncbi:uncharacterized protein LOC131947927 isoform X3 [Physella acuta]|uniref:uncharacterized protein LOC131947927 isoform X3 n=1 Tax=Physella acuta TaxID=109671 RepID=UPI0027DAD769|nr:uncharacterized protein LOC131947927 isoform X3 [Physella acuta]
MFAEESFEESVHWKNKKKFVLDEEFKALNLSRAEMGNKSSTSKKKEPQPKHLQGGHVPEADVDEGVICTVVLPDGKEEKKRVFRSFRMNEFLKNHLPVEFDVSDYEVVIYKSNNETVIPKPNEEFEEYMDDLHQIRIAARGVVHSRAAEKHIGNVKLK